MNWFCCNGEPLGIHVVGSIAGCTALVGIETKPAQRNQDKGKGGFERFPEHYRVLVALHVSWFAAMLAEVWYFRTAPPLWLVIVAFSGLAAGQTLRYLAIRTLSERWSTRIYVVPDAPLIKHGIYRFVRHPNYLGVILEIASVPLLHAAYGTAVVFLWPILLFSATVYVWKNSL